MGIRSSTLVRRRFAAGSRSSSTGRWTAGSSTDTTFRGSMQPMPEETQQMQLGSLRTTDPRIVFCDVDLTAGDQRTGVVADHVLLDGVAYEVKFVRNWSRGVKPHYEAGVVRLQET